MSFTDTEKHWLSGFAAATAASRSDVNVAMPHLRGRWSPTKAILRTLEGLFMKAARNRSPSPPRLHSPPGVSYAVLGSIRTVLAWAALGNSILRGAGFQKGLFPR